MAGSGSTPTPDEAQRSTSRSPADRPTNRPWQILIAEDSKTDVFLIRQSLQQSGITADVHIADDGEKAIRFFEQADNDPTAPCPDLILLDINMPRYKGADILRRLRSSHRCATALVLIVTSSNSEHDREEMRALGADAYFRKPSEFAEFMKLGNVVDELLHRKQQPLP
jgi:CheY-like chemotaxis protein